MTPEETKIADALFARVVFLATPESRDAALETAVTTYLHFLQACEARERLEKPAYTPSTWEEKCKAMAEGERRREGDRKAKTNWPRIRDLPESEQAPFRKCLEGQTCPEIPGIPMSEQDAYYPWDYDRWKVGLPVID